MTERYQPESMVGQFAFSRAGHDKGQLYVIVAEEGDSVLLCDGRLKTLAAPKRKKRRHIQPVSARVDGELLDRMRGAGSVRDEEIKLRIKRYLQSERLV